MATTSIWRVKGWLGKVVIYVENPDKTSNPAFVEQKDLSDRQVQGLSDVIDYAANIEKTQAADEQSEVLHSFVSGVNCHPSTARDEMIAVKKRFGKEDGTVAYHGYQSFAPGEATPEIAHEIGLKLAQRLWGDRYQVLVTTHLDKANHLHNHFVLNTVSFVDGIKYHRTAQDYRDMQAVSDALCREYGLSVISDPHPGKSKHYGEWRAEQEQRPTWRGIVRADVDEAIRQSMTERQFFENLRKKGYEIKTGKDISVRPPGKERFVRLLRNFGDDYSLDGIRKRILEQSRVVRPLADPIMKSRQYHFSGNLKSAKKITGFRALYFHYCYLLGIFPKGRPKSSKRLHFLLREDLLKMDAISQGAKQFSHEAKRYGVVYCALRGKEPSADGLVDVMVRAEDASKINRIVERFKLSTVDTASIKHEIEKTKAEKESAPPPPEQTMSEDDKLLDEMLSTPAKKEENAAPNPFATGTDKSPLSEPTSKKPDRAAEGTSKGMERKPSVREELREIRQERQQKAAPSRSKPIQHTPPKGKKKKSKAR